MDGLEQADVIEGLRPNVARARHADFATRFREWCRAKAYGDGVAIRPKDDIAGFDENARVGLGFGTDGCIKIDFLAPGASGGLDRERGPNALSRRRVEQSRAYSDAPCPDHDLSHAAQIPISASRP